MTRGSLRLAVAGALWCAASPALAEWPYLTEEARSLPLGGYSLSAGIGRTDRQEDPVPGGEGVAWTIPQIEGSLGVGPWAEVSFQYEYFYFEPDAGGDEFESGDLRLWAKLVPLRSGPHTGALRVGVKLPNASNESGLGTDETDFFALALYDGDFGPLLLSLNAGLGILGSIAENQDQDDVFLWAGALRGPLGSGFSLGFDASGQAGTRRGNHAWFGLVGDWQTGPWRFSAAGRRGVENAQGWAWLVGATYAP